MTALDLSLASGRLPRNRRHKSRQSRREGGLRRNPDAISALTSAQGRRHGAGAIHRRRRAGLSDEAGAADHPVPARRQQRHRRAHRRHPAGRAARPAGGRRQPRRRRRRHRRPSCVAKAAGRRLHAADRSRSRTRSTPGSTSCTLRPDQVLRCRSRMLGSGPERRDGPSRSAREVDQGADRARQAEAGRAAIRIRRASAASSISAASSSSSWPASISCTCRSRAAARP